MRNIIYSDLVFLRSTNVCLQFYPTQLRRFPTPPPPPLPPTMTPLLVVRPLSPDTVNGASFATLTKVHSGPIANSRSGFTALVDTDAPPTSIAAQA